MYIKRKTETEKQHRLRLEVQKHYNSGLTMREVAELMNRSRTWVWYMLKGVGDKSEDIENLG